MIFTNFTITKLNIAGLINEIYPLYKKLWPNKSKQDLKKHLSQHESTRVVLAYDKSETVAFSIFSLISIDGYSFEYRNGSYVHEDYRKKGVYTELLNNSSGLNTDYIVVRTGNILIAKIYSKRFRYIESMDSKFSNAANILFPGSKNFIHRNVYNKNKDKYSFVNSSSLSKSLANKLDIPVTDGAILFFHRIKDHQVDGL